MDLSTIQLHLDNFVTTWEGWNDVLGGIVAAVSLFTGGEMAPIAETSSNLSSYADLLSSN